MVDTDELVDSIVVEHKEFRKGLSRIRKYVRSAMRRSGPIGIGIFGFSGTGKTLMLDIIEDACPHSENADGWKRPLIRVAPDSKATTKGFLQAILRQLDPDDNRDCSEGVLSRRIETLMEGCGTTVLMVDEFQQFIDQTTDRVQYLAAESLKNIMERRKLLLVVAGLPNSEAVIRRNKQLLTRFRAPIYLPKFDWADPAQRKDFVTCLTGFHCIISRHFELEHLAGRDMAYRLYCATGGILRYLANFLKELLTQAEDDGKTRLELSDFALAYDNFKFCELGADSLVRPFDENFDLVPNLDVLAKVSLLGVPATPEPRKRSRQAI